MDTEHPRDEVHGEVERGQRDKPWQRYLDATLGLRNYWYPVLFSHELKEGETRPETILGERLFFKRINGTVYCVADRCLHRGVPFSARPELTNRPLGLSSSITPKTPLSGVAGEPAAPEITCHGANWRRRASVLPAKEDFQPPARQLTPPAHWRPAVYAPFD